MIFSMTWSDTDQLFEDPSIFIRLWEADSITLRQVKDSVVEIPDRGGLVAAHIHRELIHIYDTMNKTS